MSACVRYINYVGQHMAGELYALANGHEHFVVLFWP